MRSVLLLLAASVLAAAAELPAIENTGAPMAVPFRCDAQQLDEAGLRCTAEEPCGIYLELTALEVVGAKIFLTGNLHTRAATLSSIVLATADGGKTWTEPYERMPFTALDGIQFIDFERGWIAGQNMQSVPRDPFFLVTDDGGRTWKKQPIFEEDHPGAVEAFDFDSRTEGKLVIDTALPGDRHELYQTMTGGSEWALQRKSSAAIHLEGSHLKDSASDWRIHADAKSSTYDIEKRSGDAWQPIANFQIEPAVCNGATAP